MNFGLERKRKILPIDTNTIRFADGIVEGSSEAFDKFISQRSLTPESEIELTLEQKKLMNSIKIVIQLIQVAEAKRLGLPQNFLKFNSDKIKFVVGENNYGAYYTAEDILVINSDLINFHAVSRLVKIILHELAHRYSRQGFTFQDNRIRASRGGYEERDKRLNFLSFNEAVVEKYTFYLFNKYFMILKQVFPICKMEDNEQFRSYQAETAMLDKIVDKVSRVSNKTLNSTYELAFKGLFTGEKMWLRMVDKAFGPGSGIYLASLVPEDKSGYGYFTLETYSGRVKYALEKLSLNVHDGVTFHRYFQYIISLDRALKSENYSYEEKISISLHILNSYSSLKNRLATSDSSYKGYYLLLIDAFIKKRGG